MRMWYLIPIYLSLSAFFHDAAELWSSAAVACTACASLIFIVCPLQQVILTLMQFAALLKLIFPNPACHPE